MAIRPGDQRMHDQLAQFLAVGKAKKFFVGDKRVELKDKLEVWVPGFKAALDPAALSEAMHKQLAPQLAIFDETHRLVLAMTQIGLGWATAENLQQALDARIPRLVVGIDEEEDLLRLQTWPGIFLEVFAGFALPPSLAPAPVKKQIAAHQQASKKLPDTTAGQTYRASYANLKDLRAQGDQHFEQMHDLLDGEYGRRGEVAFKQKAEFGYDRRLRGGGPNRQQRKTDASTTTPPAQPANSAEPAAHALLAATPK